MRNTLRYAVLAAALTLTMAGTALAAVSGLAADTPLTIGASPIVSNTTVQLGPLVEALIAFMAAVIPSLGGYIAYVLKQRVNIQQGSTNAALVDMAVQRGGALALAALKSVIPANPTVDVRSTAVASGVNHVLQALPDTLKQAGVTPESVTRMVSAELVKLENAAGPQPLPAAAITPNASA